MPRTRSTLQDLTRNDWTLIESKAKRMSIRLGQEIIREGAQIDHFYILRCGSASVELEGTTSRSVIACGSASVELEGTTSRSVIAALRAGDVCGEMAFLGDRTATASVVATDEVE